jgi:hypothetical protein
MRNLNTLATVVVIIAEVTITAIAAALVNIHAVDAIAVAEVITTMVVIHFTILRQGKLLFLEEARDVITFPRQWW